MSIEDPSESDDNFWGEIPEIFPHDNDFTVNDAPDPTAGIIREEAAYPEDISPAAEVHQAETEVSAYGLARFEGIEPEFDGIPPQPYLEATYWKFDASAQHYKSLHRGLFEDKNRVVHIIEGDTPGQPIEEASYHPDTELEYIAPEGFVEIHSNASEVSMRFKDYDGNTVSYCRYFSTLESGGEGEAPYQLLRKDTTDPDVEGFVGTEGLSEDDVAILQSEADMRRDSTQWVKRQLGLEYSLVGVEEASYVFDEVFAGARPPYRTYEDVLSTIDSEQMRLESGATDPRDIVGGRMLYDKLVGAYREHVLTPAEESTWNKETERRFVSADGTYAVSNATGIVPENPVSGDEATYTVITITESLGAESLSRRIAEHDRTIPPYKGTVTFRKGEEPLISDDYEPTFPVTSEGGTATARIRFVGTDRTLTGDVLRSFDVIGVGELMPESTILHPTRKLMETVRNYLWNDVEDAPPAA